MGWLNDGFINWQREIIEQNLLPSTCVISNPVYTPDSAGALTTSYNPAGTVACRLDPITTTNAKITIELNQQMLERARILTVPKDAPLALDVRVVVDANRAYKVLSLSDDHSARVVRRAIVGEFE